MLVNFFKNGFLISKMTTQLSSDMLELIFKIPAEQLLPISQGESSPLLLLRMAVG